MDVGTKNVRWIDHRPRITETTHPGVSLFHPHRFRASRQSHLYINIPDDPLSPIHREKEAAVFTGYPLPPSYRSYALSQRPTAASPF